MLFWYDEENYIRGLACKHGSLEGIMWPDGLVV